MAKKILIIDDDPNIVTYLTDFFNDNDYETCSATDGSEALEIVKKELPDLITLDLEMPEEWGPRFYRKLSQEKEYKNIPEYCYSANIDEIRNKDYSLVPSKYIEFVNPHSKHPCGKKMP